MAGIRSVFDKSDIDVELLIEYMDTKLHDPKTLFPHLREIYAAKYYKMQPDIIISSDNNALDFLLMNRDLLFPGVPVVFCGINNYSHSLIKNQVNIIGVKEDFDFEGTIDLALHLHPKTRQIAVITDSTRTSNINLEHMKHSFPKFTDRVSFIQLTDLTIQKFKKALKHLPDNTLIIHNGLFHDHNGRNFTLQEGLAFVVVNSQVPVYSLWRFMIDQGVLGGVVVNGFSQGEHAAFMAERILQGNPLDHIPILNASPNVPVFDYNAMSRFGINRSDLPEGSIVLNVPSSLYNDHKNAVLITISGMSFLILIIFILAFNINIRKNAEVTLKKYQVHLKDLVKKRTLELEIDITKRKKTAEALKKSEHRYRSLIDTMSEGLVEVDQNWRITFANNQFIAMTGFSRDRLIGCRLQDLVSKKHLNTVQEKYKHRLQGQTGMFELELTRADGEKVVTLCSSRPYYDSKGTYSGGLGILTDITKRQKIEKALEKNKELFEKTFRSQRDAIFILNNGIPPLIIDCNPAAERIFGYTRKKLLNSKTDLLHIDTASLKAFKAMVDSSVQLNGFAYIDEFRMKHRDGTVFTSEYSVLPLEDAQQQRVGWVNVIRNIEKQKQAEQALKYREFQFKTIFNNINASIYISDIKSHKILFINDYMKTVFKRDLTGKICWQTIQADQSGPCSFCTNDRLIDAEGNPTGSYIWENYNQKLERWYELHDQAITWVDGQLVRMEIAIDITDRKKMENALQENQKRYRALADATIEAVFITENGYCIDANSTAVKMFGYSYNELIGKFGTDIIAPESKETAKRNMLSGYNRPYEVLAQKKDGTKFHVEVTGRTIRYRDRKVRVSVVHDINDRKLSEKALLKAYDELELQVEKRTLELSETNRQLQDTTNTLNNILSSSTEHAIIAIDLNFRILLYNPAAERIFKYANEEVIGKKIQEIHAKEKVGPEQFMRAIKKVRQKGIYEYDITSKNLAGEKCFIHCIIMPMKNENNDITGYILFSQDITKIKNLQDRLVRSERLAATGQLAATIAHEINSPLQGIVTLLSFLKEVYAKDKKLYENLEIVKTGFDSIKKTINKLMNLSRPGKEEKQPTNINTVINDTISLVQIHMGKLGIKVNTNLTSEIQMINGSPSQLGHVFLNLMNNAMEAMAGQSFKKEITVNSEIKKDNIVITVRDTGPGFNQKDMRHVFDPFFSTKKIMGLGMGLAICNSYIEEHNGRITVENHPSGGALFTILLPVSHKK